MRAASEADLEPAAAAAQGAQAADEASTCARAKAIERVQARFESKTYPSLAPFIAKEYEAYKHTFKHTKEADALVAQVLLME